jgi:hypothetical protein
MHCYSKYECGSRSNTKDYICPFTRTKFSAMDTTGEVYGDRSDEERV